MKFSRNPISGELESYTDEGEYVGKVFTMGDDIRKPAKDSAEFKEEEHPRDEKGRFTGGGASEGGNMKEPEGEFEVSEDPFDIFSWEDPDDDPEEEAKRKEKEKEEEKLQKERESYGQNGLNESDYPEELRLTDKEKKDIADLFREYKDDDFKCDVSTLVSDAINGVVDEDGLDKQKANLEEMIKESTEEIARKKENGYSYKTHNPQSAMNRKEKLAQWWNGIYNTGVPERWAEHGVRYWQLLRSGAIKQMNQIDFAKKVAKRYEFAKKQPNFMPWRKNPHRDDPNYKPWKETAQDGGPGSGNFGHKGRPGKVGGSGKGGGVQYRGGRSDIGYFGSRQDWLNGLQGEKQHEAVRQIAGLKREMETAKLKKDRVERLFEQGMLTRSEADDQLEKLGLKNFNEEDSPEVYLFKNGGTDSKRALLDKIKEARSWDKKKNSLIDENLSEEEKKAYEYLSDNLLEEDGVARQEKIATKINLEAKAMGIDVPIEMSDNLQYATGLKERPKPTGPDYSWYDNRNTGPYGAGNLEAYMEIAIKGSPSYGHKYTKEEFAKLNKRFLDQMAYGKSSPNEIKEYAVNAINSLRLSMAGSSVGAFGIRQSDFKYTKEMVDRLSEEEKKELLQTVNYYLNQNDFFNTTAYQNVEDITTDDFYKAERNMYHDPTRKKDDLKRIANYVVMQDKMLTGDAPTDQTEFQQALAKEKEAKEAKANAEKAQQAAEKAEKTAEWKKIATPEYVESRYHPQTVAGASRGNDMTRNEADDTNANPNRAKHSYSESGNCQTCVIAYEMRRRGYNVIAKPRKSDAEDIQKKIGARELVVWQDPETGLDAEFIRPEKKLTKKTALSWMNKNMVEGGRYTLGVHWKSGGAHILIAEKDNGVINIVDPQDGMKYTSESDIERYFSDARLGSDDIKARPRLMRIDNALPKMEYCDKILEMST